MGAYGDIILLGRCPKPRDICRIDLWVPLKVQFILLKRLCWKKGAHDRHPFKSIHGHRRLRLYRKTRDSIVQGLRVKECGMVKWRTENKANNFDAGGENELT